jgi:TonB family protein
MTLLRARPDERLDRPEKARRWPFVSLFLICLAVHLVLLGALLLEDKLSPPVMTAEQEIPVEVVVEPPQQAPQPPPPPEPKAEEPPQPEKKQQEPPPPPPKLTLDEKPAFDAPRAENKEKLDREAPDSQTKSQRLAAPNQQTAEKPDPHKDKLQQETAPQPAQEPEAAGPEEDKRDAEIVVQAAPKPAPKPEKFAQPDPKATRGEKQQSIADMVASLAPTPEFKLGGAAKSAPISGGTAKPTYLSVVLGYIKRQFHDGGGHRDNEGIITFYVDPNGNLVHQALRHSSGSPALDQAALTALKRAAPFPPTPTSTAIGLIWKY